MITIDCPDCNGTGKLEGPTWRGFAEVWIMQECDRCHGSGEIETQPEETEDPEND